MRPTFDWPNGSYLSLVPTQSAFEHRSLVMVVGKVHGKKNKARRAVISVTIDRAGYPGSAPLDEAVQFSIAVEALVRGGRFGLLRTVYDGFRRDLQAALPAGTVVVERAIPRFDITQAATGLEALWYRLPRDVRLKYLKLAWLCQYYPLIIPDGPLATVCSAFARALDCARVGSPPAPVTGGFETA